MYLPDDLKVAVKRAASHADISEAEVIRRSIRHMLGESRPKPRGELFRSGQPIAHRDDDLLSGFGER